MKHPSYFHITSLFVFLFLFSVGLILHIVSPFLISEQIPNFSLIQFTGICILMFGFIGKSSVLISHDHHYRALKNNEQSTQRGLYKIINFPLFESSFFMMLGIGCVIDSVWMVLCALLFMMIHVGYFHNFERKSMDFHYGKK